MRRVLKNLPRHEYQFWPALQRTRRGTATVTSSGKFLLCRKSLRYRHHRAGAFYLWPILRQEKVSSFYYFLKRGRGREIRQENRHLQKLKPIEPVHVSVYTLLPHVKISGDVYSNSSLSKWGSTTTNFPDSYKHTLLMSYDVEWMRFTCTTRRQDILTWVE